MLDITLNEVLTDDYALDMGIAEKRSREIVYEILLNLKKEIISSAHTVDAGKIMMHAVQLGQNDNEQAFALFKAGTAFKTYDNWLMQHALMNMSDKEIIDEVDS